MDGSLFQKVESIITANENNAKILTRLEMLEKKKINIERNVETNLKLEKLQDRLDQMEKKLKHQQTKLIYDKTNQKTLKSLNNKSKVLHWLPTFTGHGFFNLANANNTFSRFVWLLIMLTSVSFCFYFICNVILQFLSYDVVTSIRVIRSDEIDFPAVIFCEDSNDINFDEHLRILDCTYHKIPCDFWEIFEKVTILYWGTYTTCLRFNVKKLNSNVTIYTADRPGWEYCLYMVLSFPKHLDYYIGDNTYEPVFSNIKGVINPGILTDLVLSKTVQRTLGPPYNKCLKEGQTFDSDLFRETIQSGYTYRQVNCYDRCLSKIYIEKCNPMKNKHSNECYNNLTAYFDFKKLCSVYCPIECDSVTFTADTMTLDFNSITWPIIPAKYANETFNVSSIFSLWIYFDHIEYTAIDQIPKMTGTDLVSNVGGTLGLFLGLSFISFAEIFELVGGLCYTKFKRRKNVVY